MGFDEWLAVGVRNGWVSEACGMHDTLPLTDAERARVELGQDPCVPMLRVYVPE
jgi:hypothetical protein